MKTQHFFQKVLCTCGRVMPGFIFLLLAREAGANPTGMTVVSGSATSQTSGSQLNVTVSQHAVLDWSSFNIAAGERTVFNQPSSTSVVVNHITDQNPSLIYGSLQANGMVVLLNSSGFYFGPNSFVSAAGLMVSTANCMPPQNTGGAWQFNGPPPLATIVNYGQVKIGHGGDCFFIADKIENHGTIQTDGGSIAFAAGQTVTLSERPDGRGMSMQVTLPQGSVDNYGNVIADGGTIALHAKVVNQDGFIQANSVRDNHGVIELVAADSLSLGADSKISAAGDNTVAVSAGGTVTFKSDNVFRDDVGSQITTTGGARGGNGGDVEVSAPKVTSLQSAMNAGAHAGYTGGSLLLDPDNIILGSVGDPAPDSGTVDYNAPGTLYLNVASGGSFANKNFSSIKLQATGDITMDPGAVWDLSGSTGNPNGGLVTLQAGGKIFLDDGAQIIDANSWSLTMQAGYDFFAQKVVPYAYPHGDDPAPPDTSIILNGSSAIVLAQGTINLTAGKDILVGTGRIITTGGGNIMAHALAGNIDTGGYGLGFLFQEAETASQGYYIDSERSVGGISTAGGGNVSLIAGGDVKSVLPAKSGFYFDDQFTSPTGSADDAVTAGSGAYSSGGIQAGDVQVIAGGNVTGHYLVSNGKGSIFAGVRMDADGNPIPDGPDKYVLGNTGSAGLANVGNNHDNDNNSIALSLINGGWNVTAAQDIVLQEVRNPNGIFNNNKTLGVPASYHGFDYGAADYVKLTAGNLVQLGTTGDLPRTTTDRIKVPVIYPGILNIIAGADGVKLVGNSTYNQLVLFPSEQGSLTIKTTDGGSLLGLTPDKNGDPAIFNLIMSDSGETQFNPRPGANNPFSLGDHAASPWHLDHKTDFILDISGDMSDMLIGAAEEAHITMGGDMINSRFQGMNLSPGDTTFIHVGGDIINRSTFTTIDLSAIVGAGTPDLSLIAHALISAGDPAVATLLSAFYYNPTTHILTYQTIPGLSIPKGNYPSGVTIRDDFDYVLYRLQHLTVQQYINGQPQWSDPPFNTTPKSIEVAVINATTAEALYQQFKSLGVAPSNGNAFGYTLGGGGTFEITAHDLDLGTTAGIQSMGAGLYNVAGDYPLRKVSDTGANILVNLTGDLTMFSSSIASLNGGDVYVNADGNLNVGSSQFTVTSLGVRGIYSTGQGNVGVYAGKDINVEGSRIAVYDTRPYDPAITTPGGSLTVVSREGDVNVGSGGSGYVTVSSFYVDPITKELTAPTPTIPGSGLLQTSYNLAGNALIEALAGNVNIGAGGIEQVLFKGNKTVLDRGSVANLFKLALEGDLVAANAYQNTINGITPGQYVPYIDVYSGYALEKLDPLNNNAIKLDAFGNPLITAFNRNDGTLVKIAEGKTIDASGSGIVGAGTATLKATGDIRGNIISFGDVTLDATKNINVTVFGLGTVSVASANGSISGTIIGVGGINASGSSIDANLESNGTISGDTSGNTGFAASATAGNVAAGLANENNSKVAQKADDNDDELNKKKKGIALAQKVSRVTVLLPPKN